MKLRVLKKGSKLIVCCMNGSVLDATEEILKNSLTGFNKPHLCKGTAGAWDTECADMSELSGETLAYIDDTNKLVVVNNKTFESVLKKDIRYISVSEYAELHGKCRASIKNMCPRIEGAYQTSSGWLIPADAPYPKRKKREVKKADTQT